MLAYRNVKDIVQKAIQWESQLKGFYEVAEVALRNPVSRDLVMGLRQGLEERLRILEGLNVERHGAPEWMQFAPGVGMEELIRKNTVTRDSTPVEILASIVVCDEALQGFYRTVADLLVSRSLKELFESLVVFKTQQIESVRALMAHGGPERDRASQEGRTARPCPSDRKRPALDRLRR